MTRNVKPLTMGSNPVSLDCKVGKWIDDRMGWDDLAARNSATAEDITSSFQVYSVLFETSKRLYPETRIPVLSFLSFHGHFIKVQLRKLSVNKSGSSMSDCA